MRQVSAENRYPDLKSEGEQMIRVMKDDGVIEDSVNELTIKRYVSLGKRCAKHLDILMRWEAFHARETLIDSIYVLRQVFSISDREDDMAVVLNALFMEQRSGIRSTLIKTKSKHDVRDPGMVARTMLIRSSLYLHLHNTFPKIQDIIVPFMNGSCYAEYCGVDAMGKRISATTEDVETDDETEPAPFTSQRSRVSLAKLASMLMKCRFEVTLCKMANDDRFNAKTLNLTHPDAGLIKKHINEIEELYKADFQQEMVEITNVTHTTNTSGPADGVTVQLVGDGDDIGPTV